MANPQIENGFTKIANELLDALIASNISGQDFKIALLIIRKTYGFNKHEDAVSLSQMMQATGMGKIRCSQVVTRLQLMKILTVTENINGIGKKYKFNKDFEKWDTVKKNINRYQKVKPTVNENINHKRNSYKRNKTYTDDFQSFYKAYPKKKARDAAWRAWQNRNGDRPEIEIILKAIESQKQTEDWKKESGKYIPHPSTWINQGRWADENEIPKQKGLW